MDIENMTYEQTCELERNIKIKNKAKEIVAGFKDNVTLNLNTKNGLRFTIWSDSHNAIYLEISNEKMFFICDFLNENYAITVDESCVFSGIASGNNVIGHLASLSKVQYNQYEYKKK